MNLSMCSVDEDEVLFVCSVVWRRRQTFVVIVCTGREEAKLIIKIRASN